MLFTGWSLEGVQQGAYALGTGTWASAWVKMGSQWLCMALYGWSLFAHLALRGRSFALRTRRCFSTDARCGC